MITFDDIAKANEGLSTVPVKGKDYVVVPQRVKAFRKIYPEGFILTDILSHENGVVVMQAKAGYYLDGNPVVLGSGLAFEKEDSSYINKTSYIENCETSAIGRALGFLGLGIDAAICSAEELVNAINNQDKQDAPKQKPAQKPQNKAVPASVSTQATVPQPQAQAPAQAEKPAETKPETPGAFLTRMIGDMKARYADYGFNFMEARNALIQGGLVPDVPSATMTMEQAQELVSQIAFIYEERKAKAAS